tara:strand:- start:444 stop:629 length:186 start_codon:yes stop_codon:yes gene_type:complete
MSKEQDLYNWCCLQTLLYKAGLLDEEQKEKLVELDPNFFDHYMDQIKGNLGHIKLIVEDIE